MFKPVPDPNGSFSSSIPSPVIYQANQEVLNVMEANGEPRKRKLYKKISDTLYEPR